MISEPEGKACQMSYGRKEGDIGGTERKQDDITPQSQAFLVVDSGGLSRWWLVLLQSTGFSSWCTCT